MSPTDSENITATHYLRNLPPVVQKSPVFIWNISHFGQIRVQVIDTNSYFITVKIPNIFLFKGMLW